MNKKPLKDSYYFNGWFVKKFNEVDEIRVKKEVERKNGFNNFNKNFNTRWIGELCELAFKAWLEDRGIVYDYLAEGKDVDVIDFQVGTFLIDVKGVSSKYFPRKDWVVNLDSNQYQITMKKGYPVNSFVFARYILPYRSAVILGVMSKWRFMDVAEFYKAGTKRGKIVLSTDNYEMPIYNLSGLDFIEKNRYFEWWL